jgi:hypothetical protein
MADKKKAVRRKKSRKPEPEAPAKDKAQSELSPEDLDAVSGGLNFTRDTLTSIQAPTDQASIAGDFSTVVK